MNRRSFLKSIGCSLSVAMAGGVMPSVFAEAAKRKTNILFVMSDDHAAHAISAYGSKLAKTPNLDRLANEGVLFDHVFVTNSICTPSRACILSGMYSCQNGVPVFNDISPKLKTVGGYMRDAGYFTAVLGKWHMGGLHSVRESDWDRAAIYQGQGNYYNPFFFSKTGTRSFKPVNNRLDFPGEYASSNLTKVTQDVIDEALDAGKPFFVMMLHKAPHRNWIPEEKYRKIFRQKTLDGIPMPETLFDDYKGRATPIKRTAMTLEHHMRLDSPHINGGGTDLKLSEYFCHGGTFPGVDPEQYKPMGKGRSLGRWPEEIRDNAGLAAPERERRRRERIKLSYLRYMQDYLACCQSVDDSVGEMLDYLDKKGVGDNTMVIYTADQGFFLGDHGLYDKRFMMDESLKMPFLLRCPAMVKAGQVNRDIITNVDFASLFVDVAGAEKPAGFQGRSFLQNITTGTPTDWPKSCYYRYYIEGGEHGTPAHYGVRTARYKLIRYYKVDEWELFDLQKDPDECHNCYGDAKYAPVVAALKAELFRLKHSLGDSDQFYNAHEYSPNPRIDTPLIY